MIILYQRDSSNKEKFFNSYENKKILIDINEVDTPLLYYEQNTKKLCMKTRMEIKIN